MIKVGFNFPLLLSHFLLYIKMLLSCLLIKTQSPFYSSFCSSLLYIPINASPPLISLNAALDYFLMPFLTLPLAHLLSGCLHPAALGILHFNSNTGFLSPCITDMPQRPWQLPLCSSCHRPTFGCTAEMIFLAMNFEQPGSFNIQYSVFNTLFLKALWKKRFLKTFHSTIKITLDFLITTCSPFLQPNVWWISTTTQANNKHLDKNTLPKQRLCGDERRQHSDKHVLIHCRKLKENSHNPCFLSKGLKNKDKFVWFSLPSPLPLSPERLFDIQVCLFALGSLQQIFPNLSYWVEL